MQLFIILMHVAAFWEFRTFNKNKALRKVQKEQSGVTTPTDASMEVNRPRSKSFPVPVSQQYVLKASLNH